MKTLHLSIITILVSCLTVSNPIFADNDSHLTVTTDYGGNGIMVNSNQTMSPVLPSPPLGMYPYTSKIFSVFQIEPEIIHPTDTSYIHILVTNNANFTLYDVNLGESSNDSKSLLFSNIHKIDILNPNQTKTIYGTLHVSADAQPTDYYDIWWNIVAKNQTGNMIESIQFHRNLLIIQNLPKYSGPAVITLESPLKQFKSGVAAEDVKCNDGLHLIMKSENYFPRCVKPDTESKLVERGWALTRLSISGLKQTYDVGEKINVIINFQGVLHNCDHPNVLVVDSNQNMVWKSQDVNSMCISAPFNPVPYVDQRFDLNSGYGGPIIMNKTENYTMKVSLDGNNMEKGFTVK